MIDEFKAIFYSLYKYEVLPLNLCIEIDKELQILKGEDSINKIDSLLFSYVKDNPNNFRADYLLFFLPGRYQESFALGPLHFN